MKPYYILKYESETIFDLTKGPFISVPIAAAHYEITPEKLLEMLKENNKKVFKKVNPLNREIGISFCDKNEVQSLFPKMTNPFKQSFNKIK